MVHVDNGDGSADLKLLGTNGVDFRVSDSHGTVLWHGTATRSY